MDRDSPGIRTHEPSSGGQFHFNSCPTKSQSFPFGELHEGDTSQACHATSRIDWNVGAEKGWTYGTITTVILPGLKLIKHRVAWGVEPRHSLTGVKSFPKNLRSSAQAVVAPGSEECRVGNCRESISFRGEQNWYCSGL